MNQPRVCLTVAGLDPSGGAGIVADLNTFSAFGCFGAAAISSITFQNTTGVFGAEHQTGETVRRQVEPIFADYTVAAAKTGMLPTRDVIETTASLFGPTGIPLVVDPVVRSTSGFDLIDNPALLSLIEQMFPLATLITPNIPEAERISGIAIENEQDIRDAAGIMRKQGARNVLIKGGHFDAPQSMARDFLFAGDTLHILEAEYINTTATHGTGCTLAAAITANLALGNDLAGSVRAAKEFVTKAIRTSPGLGKGHSPINHFVNRQGE
jgi:hydroxymethylpyrimidine/phosphomethylpyrimidine kinase